MILAPRARTVIIGIAFVSLSALGAGLVVAPVRAWSSLLTAAFLYVSVALGCAVLVALHHVANAAWLTPLKRVPEAIAGWLPVGALTMLCVLPGVHVLYHWSHHDAVAHDAVLQSKHAWLNVPFFAARMVALLVLWNVFASALRRLSIAQDRDHDVAHTRRSVVVSAVFLVVAALSFSVAAFDWMMSLDPHWQSTIFAFYNIAGMLVGAVATVAAGVIFLRRRGHLPNVGVAHLHDLGKLAFGFSTLWAYMWFCQYMLIWYSNLPEETTWFVARSHGGWGFLFWSNLAVGWVVPFVMLLSRDAKRSEGTLLAASAVIVVARWLDIWLMVAPANMPDHPGIGLLELCGFVGIGSLFVLVVERALRRAPLLPEGDPYLAEGAHHHG